MDKETKRELSIMLQKLENSYLQRADRIPRIRQSQEAKAEGVRVARQKIMRMLKGV